MNLLLDVFGITFMFPCIFFSNVCATGLRKNTEYDLNKNRMKSAIRKDLLKDYDKVIGPVKYGPGYIQNVFFSFEITNVVEVNTKEQLFKVDGWVIQRWIDEFLSWNITSYNDEELTTFSPEEIWLPDIVLLNNADRNEKLAGGSRMFLTNIMARFNGDMLWLSPASFTSGCKQNVRKWPTDTQVCELTFGSCTLDIGHMKIEPFVKKYKKGSVSNGLWNIEHVSVSSGSTDHRECCNKKYSTAIYKITLSRKPKFYMFYIATPVIILVILALMSFFIPIDSGEKIGFITTILLAMMVFLLMIPEYLPKTSDEIPVLGTLLIFAMVIISTVLIATIFILTCYYAEGRPSIIIQKLLFPFKTRSIMKVKDLKKNEVKPIQEVISEEVELPSGKDEEQITWKNISCKLNWIFLISVCLISGIVISFLLHL